MAATRVTRVSGRRTLGTALAILPWVAAAALTAKVPSVSAQASGGQKLTGAFRIAAGACTGGSVSGSVFRMVVPSGSAGGPFVSNNDSTCSDHTYTALTPGSDGGLESGTFQPEPSPAFDGSGNSLANRITKPALFYGIAFSTSTNSVDPQTGTHVEAPSLTVQNGKLTGDLRAFAASWNRQEFNQGAPKPDGSSPGNTSAPTGTYNAGTGAFVLDWASQIQGGPFNNFTGYWHLEGTFVSARGTTTATTASQANVQASTNPAATNRGGATGATLAGGSTGAVATPAVGAPPTLPAPGFEPPTTLNMALAPPAGQELTNQAAATIGRPFAPHRRGDVAPIGLVALLLAAAAAGTTGWYAVIHRRGATS